MTGINEQFTRASKRAQAVAKYFETEDYLHEFCDRIQEGIIENGRGWIARELSVPGSWSALGAAPQDAVYLKKMEARLKEIFPCIDHLRFSGGPDWSVVVVDTKPNTLLRRVLVSPNSDFY
ncbi:MAG TPA: hypothetical protein VL625_05215 [Patescibacteria group bacterium]|jgi:hypothetical protein|nr:hypothetical protein [Patescibacteria group bacterium]